MDDRGHRGRISNATLAEIAKEFEAINTTFNTLARSTGVSLSSLKARFNLTTRVHVGKNHWNYYRPYFKENMESELAHLEDVIGKE
jgi:hypothetical protein